MARRWAPHGGRALGGFFAVVAVLYVVLVPRGLPYDEPSHWADVLHVARTWTIPRIGAPDVTYEAQQAPLAYYADALVYRAAGGGDSGFYSVRLTGLLWLALLSWLLARAIKDAAPELGPWAVRAGVLVAAWNPMVLACAMSVQNDVPAVALTLAAVLAARDGVRRSAVLGGLAVLTKVSVLPAVLVVPFWIAWRRRSWRPLAHYLGVLLAVCGWWFVRNEVLYGDLTGTHAVAAAGYRFGPLPATPSLVLHLGREAVTYLWLPVEYWRNTVHAGPVAALAVAGTVAVLLGGWRTLRPMPTSAVAAVSVLAWVLTCVMLQAVAFRTAYAALAAWAIAAARTGRTAVPAAGLIGLVAVLNVWSLAAVAAR